MRRVAALLLLLTACGNDPPAPSPDPSTPPTPARHHHAPEPGPCAPMLITGCGECLSECVRLDHLDGDRYANVPSEMGAAFTTYVLGTHCIDGDCRSVYAHTMRQCYGLCSSVFEGWPECADRDGECVTLTEPIH